MTRFSSLNNLNSSRRRQNMIADAVQPLEQRVLLSTVSIANATANEGSPLMFTVSLDSAAASPITVNYSTANKTAKAGHDYSNAKGTLTFDPGQTSQTLSVDTLDNDIAGPDLTMNVKLSKPTKGVKASPNKAVGTISNIDAAPVLSVTSPAPIASFSKGSKTLTFTINETGSSTSKVSVPYSTQDISAVAGVDYIAKSGTAKFSGKKTSFAVKVKIKPDANLDEDKDFLLQLSSPENATIGTPSYGVGVIGTTGTTSGATISAAPANVTAGSAASITVTLSQPAADSVTVQYATSNGTALAGTDYTTTNGTLTFPVGTTSQTIAVPTNAASAGGTFNVTLSSPNNAAISTATSVVTITPAQNHVTLPLITVNNPTVAEATSGNTTATFTLTLSAPSSQAVTIHYATADGSAIAGVNYTAVNDTLTIPAGTTSAAVQVTILGNVTSSANFILNLSNPTNATLAASSATATITNSASLLPSLSIADVAVNEATSGTATATFTVTLNAVASNDVQVNYSTSDGTAVAGTNYTTANGTLTILAGSQTANVSVTILGGVATNATFTVNLSSPVNATISSASATGTIINPSAAQPTLSVADVSQDEGTGASSTFDFPVTLSAPSANPVTVTYTTTDGTATGEADNANNPNADYYTASGTLTFLPGTTSQNIEVTVIGDTTVEPDETFTITLSAPTNATLNRAAATGTILNDDTTQPSVPAIAVNDAAVAEATGGSTAQFLVSLTSAASSDVTVFYGTSDGTAVAGTNYTAKAGELTFTPGQTSQIIDVAVLDDTNLTAPSATFSLTLTGPSSNATLANAVATGTIYSNSGIAYTTGGSTGFAGSNQVGINHFNYSVTSTRANDLADAQIQFFLTPIGQDLNTATPFRVADIGPIAAAQTISGTIDLSGAPALTTGMSYSARLISTTGIVTIVYDVNVVSDIQTPG